MKITDNDYVLPLIEAIELKNVFESGRTSPAHIRGVTRNGIRGEYVVKFSGSPEMNPASSCYELIAACIAHELDLLVPEPAAIHISPEFVETLVGQSIHKIASQSIGINFGCKFIPGLQKFVMGFEMPPYMLDMASRIFAFDILISNPDRGVNQKSNMLTNGRDLLIYDHELAFSFTLILSIFRSKTPWKIEEYDLKWIKGHCLFPFLSENARIKPIDFTNFEQKLLLLNDGFWDKLITIIPEPWSKEKVDEIKSHIYSLIDNRQAFFEEVKRVLV